MLTSSKTPLLLALAAVVLLSACPAEEKSDGNNGFAPVCESDFDLCGESCVSTSGDPFHCGECDNECPDGNHCQFGSCREVEDCRETPCEGLSVCDESSGRCVPGCTSNTQCGNIGEFCDSELMQCVCDPGEHVCDGRCAGDADVRTCGDRCSPCPTDPNGEPVCDEGECALECAGGFLACDGSCAACPAGAGSVACDGDTCVATECEGDDTLICDNVCATCPTQNVVSVTCDGTACVPDDCDAGFHVCGDACVDSTSVDHCGDSCSPCPTDASGTATCSAGACGLTCDRGTRLCDGGCEQCPSDGVATTTCDGDSCVAATCDQGRRACDGACPRCPDDGVAESECDGRSCVASACEEGRLVCGGECPECPSENVAEVGCRRGACHATTCVEGSMLCDDTCSVCPTGESVGSVGCAGTECVATSCASGWLRCPDGCCQWNFVEADTATGVNGYDVSVAVGDDGVVHAAHANISLQDMRYGVLDGERWLFTSADEGPSRGRSNSIALDPAGNPRISYRDDTADSVIFASLDDGLWTVEVVDPAGDPWDTTGMAIDAEGTPHIAYHAFLENLRYTSKPADEWITEEIAPRGDKATLVLDDDDNPWVCFAAAGSLRCASRAAEWETVTVGALAGLTFPHPQVSAVWHDGALWVAYRDRTEAGLVLARVSGQRVTMQMVDDGEGAGTAVGLAIQDDGTVHIAYTVADVGVRYAVGQDDFEISDVATAQDTDEYVAIGVTPDGTPHLLFQMGTNLMHATF
jgi:hypothetical protein